jgi:hypothetical protein
MNRLFAAVGMAGFAMLFQPHPSEVRTECE